MMKYTVVIPYYKRESLHNTLLSYEHFYRDRDDVEILILEDKKNVADVVAHATLLGILERFESSLLVVREEMTYDNYACPCSTMNYGATIARGEFILITNPECMHIVDILKGTDEEFVKSKNVYIVCGCVNVAVRGRLDDFSKFSYVPGPKSKWYQHSKRNNRMLNFCTLISKENFIKVRGFNELFDGGLGKADVEFIGRVIKMLSPNIVLRDDLLSLHQYHEIMQFSENYQKLIGHNQSVRGFKSMLGLGTSQAMKKTGVS